MLTNATQVELSHALSIINKKYYQDNITFNRLEQQGKYVGFTLKVKDSHKYGARLGYPRRDWKTGKEESKQRHLISACWHVHGNFFDALFSVNPIVRIMARGKAITINEGNWEDFDVGSTMFPITMSELCKCSNYEERQKKLFKELGTLPVSLYY